MNGNTVTSPHEPLYFDAQISQFDGIKPTPLQVQPTILQTIDYISGNARLKSDIEMAINLLQQELADNHRDPKTGKLLVDAYNKAKINLPGVTWTGIYEKRRSNTSLVTFSGFLSFDIDFINKEDPGPFNYEDLREQARKAYALLCKDEYTAFLFPSVSATGIKGLVRIPHVKNDAEYKSYFRAYRQHVWQSYKITLDSLPDISRLCFLSYCEKPYINKEASLFTQRYNEEHPSSQKPQQEPAKHTDPSVKAAVNVLLKYGIQETLSRNDFVGLCAACRRAGIAYDDFDRIMQKTPGYNQKENFKIWNTAQPDDRENPMTISSLMSYAVKADRVLFREYRKHYLQQEKEEAEEDNMGLASLIEKKLSVRYEFKLNTVNDKITVKSHGKIQLMSDYLESEIRCWLLDQGFGKRDAITDVIRNVSFKHQFHPIEQYFERLTWDDQDHFLKLSSFFTEENPKQAIFPEIFRAWCVGAIRRVFTGQHHQVLIFTGDQGKGKSFFAKWLCPYPEYFLDSPVNPDTNDARIRLSEKFIWEIGELGSTTRKADIEALRQFISLEDPTYRRAHNKYDQKKRALASFVGTVNEDGIGFLNDPTGYRRWWPVRILNIDFSYAEKIDKHQIWAQAYQMYKDDCEMWCMIPDAIQEQINQNIEQEFAVDEPMLEVFLDTFECTGEKEDAYSTADILIELEKNGYKRDKMRVDSMYLAKTIKLLQRDGYPIQKYRTANFRGYTGLRLLSVKRQGWHDN